MSDDQLPERDPLSQQPSSSPQQPASRQPSPQPLSPHPPSPRVLRWALRAHPKASRAAHAPELEAIFAEATRDAGRFAVLREALDVAGHGLRQRLGLDGTRRSAAVLGRAAPLAAAAYAGSSLSYLLHLLPTETSFGDGIGPVQLMLADEIGATALWLAVLGLLLANRWGAARLLAVLGTLLQIPLVLAALPGLAGLWSHATTVALVPSMALCGLVLAPPRDLLDSARRDGRLITALLVLGLLPWTYERMGVAALLEVYNPEALELLLWSVLLIGTLPFLVRGFLLRGFLLRRSRGRSVERRSVEGRGGAAAALAVAALVALIRYAAAVIANVIPGQGLTFTALAAGALVLVWFGGRAARRSGSR